MWQGHAFRQTHTSSKGLDSSFSKFEPDIFEEECEQYFDQLTSARTNFDTQIAAVWKVQNPRRLL